MMRGLGLLRHVHAPTSSVLKSLRPAIASVVCRKNVRQPRVPDLTFRIPTANSIRYSSNNKTATGKISTANSPTEVLSVLGYLKEIKNAPVPALTLGLAGLLPFASVPMYLSMSGTFSPSLAFAQAAYSASILSFLGGVRWGFSVADKIPGAINWENLGYSVTPSLVAWVALLMPLKLSALTVASGLVFAAYADITMEGYSAWFKGLRLLLTIVAVTSLLLTLKHSFFLKENQPGKHKENTISSKA